MQFIKIPTEANSGHLLRNIVLFGRLLRSVGINVTPTQIVNLAHGLEYIDITNRRDFKNSARTLLVNRPEHLQLFDQAFDLFWQVRDEDTFSRIQLQLPTKDMSEDEPEPPESHSQQPKITPDADNSLPEEQDTVDDKALSYSNLEVLRQKDFAGLSNDELNQIKQMMRTMAWHLEQRRTRRKTPNPHGAFIDMRRTLRQNLRYGGEPIQLAWRKQQLKRRPLVVICDISGSMERYSRILLEFIYVISNGLDKVEAFAFSTRLTRLTHQLKHRDINLALDQAVSSIHDMGGGTRIGEALKSFNYKWGRRVLGQGAIVLVISDGWDRGEITLLDREIKRLQLSCQRLIWLNPLIGSRNYQPLVRGIQTVLPYIDDFLPVHNLHALEQLGTLLQNLGEHKPLRRQQVTTHQVIGNQ